MSRLSPPRRHWTCAAALSMLLLMLPGCASLLPPGPAPALTYSLTGLQRARAADAPLPPSSSAPGKLVALIVRAPRAASGYDSRQMVYTRVAHQLEHFARSEWVDTPARMLAPLIVSALENTSGLRAIGPATGVSIGDLRLDTEVLQLQQEFGNGPSRVRFVLRATLSDNASRQVLSQQVFDETVASASEDAYGGVVAANRAVQRVLEQLARHCAEASAAWRASLGDRRTYSPPLALQARS